MSSLIDLSPEQHKAVGIQLFNEVWELMDKEGRSIKEEDLMLNAAHASLLHWRKSNPSPVNVARGEWQISRVYCVLNRAEPALHHARRSLEICLDNGIGDFDLAFGYEAVARALMIAGNIEECRKSLDDAKIAANNIQDPEDKALVLKDLSTIVIP